MFFMQPQDEEVDARHDAAQPLYYQVDIEEMGLINNTVFHKTPDL